MRLTEARTSWQKSRSSPRALRPAALSRRIIRVSVPGPRRRAPWSVRAATVRPSSALWTSSAVYGTRDLAVYSATKFAVRGLTEALDLELGVRGIHVCDVI